MVQFTEEEFKHLVIALGRMPKCKVCKGILNKINILRWQGGELEGKQETIGKGDHDSRTQ